MSAHVVMACIVSAYVVMAHIADRGRTTSHATRPAVSTWTDYRSRGPQAHGRPERASFFLKKKQDTARLPLGPRARCLGARAGRAKTMWAMTMQAITIEAVNAQAITA